MDMTLGCEIVNLVRLSVLDDADQIRRICHVAIMKNKPYFLVMEVLIEMVDTACIERGGTTFYAMDNISFIKQEFCKICAILTSGSGDQSYSFRHGCSVPNLATSFHTRSPAAVNTYTKYVIITAKISGQPPTWHSCGGKAALADCSEMLPQ